MPLDITVPLIIVWGAAIVAIVIIKKLKLIDKSISYGSIANILVTSIIFTYLLILHKDKL